MSFWAQRPNPIAGSWRLRVRVALDRKRKQLTGVLAPMRKNQKLFAGPRNASTQQMRPVD
jgi:hypothetical protein